MTQGRADPDRQPLASRQQGGRQAVTQEMTRETDGKGWEKPDAEGTGTRLQLGICILLCRPGRWRRHGDAIRTRGRGQVDGGRPFASSAGDNVLVPQSHSGRVVEVIFIGQGTSTCTGWHNLCEGLAWRREASVQGTLAPPRPSPYAVTMDAVDPLEALTREESFRLGREMLARGERHDRTCPLAAPSSSQAPEEGCGGPAVTLQAWQAPLVKTSCTCTPSRRGARCGRRNVTEGVTEEDLMVFPQQVYVRAAACVLPRATFAGRRRTQRLTRARRVFVGCFVLWGVCNRRYQNYLQDTGLSDHKYSSFIA